MNPPIAPFSAPSVTMNDMLMTQKQREAFALRNYALKRVDEAPFSWCHIRTILVAGVGFFADAYDLFAVNFVNVLLGYIYYPDNTLPCNVDVSIKMASSVGTVIGQVSFGVLIDMYGRKKMYGTELIIMIIATLNLTLGTTGKSISVIGVTIFWRVILGIGIGADYPNSSVLVSEFATVRWRGAMIASVFAFQGLGAFSAAMVSLLCAAGFKNALNSTECNEECQLALDKSWRIIYGMGILPAVIALYFRLTIPETIRYTLDISHDEPNAVRDAVSLLDGERVNETTGLLGQALHLPGGYQAPPKASFSDFKRFFGLWKNTKVLIGTAGSWFLLDVAFYGVGLNTSTILSIIGYGSGSNETVYVALRNLGRGNIILSLAGLIPGYWFSVAFIDMIGRKRLQFGGFLVLTILFAILGFGLHTISNAGLVVLICMANFFCGFGPNATTFVIPGEAFPTRYRSTAHGISAASGKVGAILSQVLIGPLRDKGGTNVFLNHVMEIFALFMFLGLFTTSLIPETTRKSLEELSGELTYVLLNQMNFKEKRSVSSVDDSRDISEFPDYYEDCNSDTVRRVYSTQKDSKHD